MPYEERGIRTVNPQPSVFILNYKNERDEIILKSIDQDLYKVTQKIPVTDNPIPLINNLRKILEKIDQYKSELENQFLLDQHRAIALRKIHEIRLNKFLNEAKKAEFKGHNKKALDQYYEALYLLKTDNIDDSLQEDKIFEIEKKINRLGGHIEK